MMDTNLWPRLIKMGLMKKQLFSIKTAIVKIGGNFFANEHQIFTDHALNHDCVIIFYKYLSENGEDNAKNLKKECLWSLSNVCASTSHKSIQFVLENNMDQSLTDLISQYISDK